MSSSRPGKFGRRDANGRAVARKNPIAQTDGLEDILHLAP